MRYAPNLFGTFEKGEKKWVGAGGETSPRQASHSTGSRGGKRPSLRLALQASWYEEVLC